MSLSIHSTKAKVGKRAALAFWRSRLPLATRDELATLGSVMGDGGPFVIYTDRDVSAEERAREDAIASLLNEMNVRHAEPVDWRATELPGAFHRYLVESRMAGEREIWQWTDVPKHVLEGLNFTRRNYRGATL